MSETLIAHPVRGWWFSADRNLANGDGRPVVLGQTLTVDPARVMPCTYGLHASAFALDALQYAPGALLWRVELGGRIVPDGDPPDKYAASERTAIAGGIDISSQLREFARGRALDVIHLWAAPRVVREYLVTGADSLRAAAWAAASAATWAAGAAARAATSDAAPAAASAATWAAGAAARAATSDAAPAAASAATWAAGAAARAATSDAALAAALAATWAATSAAALAAASAAARDAAWDAARDAARDAADAAGDAAWDAQRERFETLCLTAVEEHSCG